jgi:hypothetical protein
VSLRVNRPAVSRLLPSTCLFFAMMLKNSKNERRKSDVMMRDSTLWYADKRAVTTLGDGFCLVAFFTSKENETEKQTFAVMTVSRFLGKKH